jgi:multidrug efflux pump subunit AcrA (membrane-fusion protein)
MTTPRPLPRTHGIPSSAGKLPRTLSAACLALGLCLGLAACGKKEEAKPQAKAPDPVPVALAAVRTQAVQREIEVVGTLWGDEDTTVAAKVAGRVTAVHKDVGDPVAANEPLAQIDPTDYELAQRQRELAISEALAKIGLTELPGAGKDYDPVNVPTVQRAKLQAENAQARFERGKSLFEQAQPRISEQEFDDLRTAVDVAKRDYDVAELNARATLEEARARVADLEVAKQRLVDTVVRTPNAMVPGEPGEGGAAPRPRTYSVASRMVSIGNYVREGDPMFRLVDDNLVKLRAPVPERFGNQIAVGQEVAVTVEASTETFTGRVARINPQIDPANRTFEIEVVVPNPDHKLKPGAFARARVKTHTQSGVVFVPQQAIVSFAGVNKVFTVKDGKAQEVRIDLGQRQQDWVEVRGDSIKGEDSVVIAGNTKLATGVPVRVEPTPSTAGAAATTPRTQSPG